MKREMKMQWIVSIWLTIIAVTLSIAGCPGQNANLNWPVDPNPMDGNPSITPAAVRVLDMDGDGLKDAVTVWRGAGNVNETLGNVEISFQTPGGAWVAVALDATAITQTDESTTVNNQVTPDPQTIARYADANAVYLADMNNDGNPDILVASGNHIVYLQAPAGSADIRDPSKWQVFDIIPYVITTTTSNGTTTTTKRLLFRSCFDVAAADINGDGRPDIVAALNDINRVIWLEAPLDPSKSDDWKVLDIDRSSRSRADSLVVMDMDGDTLIDVVSSATGDTAGVISWYKNPGNPSSAGAIWKKHRITSLSGATRFAFGDLDGNGSLDMAAISPDTRQVAWFPRPANITSASEWSGWVLKDYSTNTADTRVPFGIAIADMNGDGQMNIVVGTSEPAGLFYYAPKENPQVSWLERRIAAIANINIGLFAVDNIVAADRFDVIVPIADNNPDLDRVERFLNPGQ